MNVVEASIADLRSALDEGKVTSVELVGEYLRRIAFYDHHGIRLNAVVDLSRDAFRDARASDLRRKEGKVLSVLDGIPYTTKDSYKVKDMFVAAGSPAFANLVATEDAFVISRLRAGGAVIIGRTNMPPLACGGMQRGLDGRAESPYNGAYLTAAWTSGSSNGSGTATAASFATFGLGEETWSSGRAPANNNALCAYTPSWGVISLRGNWPLNPTMDVVVPHTRTMMDMLDILNVIVADDDRTRGDFWRVQTTIEIPATSKLRPEDYTTIARGTSDKPLAGMRIGMPSKYLGSDPGIPVRPSVISLARDAAERMRSLGAEVVECDLPVVDKYEHSTHPFPRSVHGGLQENGYLPEGYADLEFVELVLFGLEDFLRANAAGGSQDGPKTLADVNPDLVFPIPNGQIVAKRLTPNWGMGEYVRFLRDGRFKHPNDIPLVAEGLRGLQRARQELLEDWMDREGFTALAFPTSCDVGPVDADINPESNAIATRNGTWVANGNTVLRHLGIPTVTIPMGIADDIAMPFGITFAGRGWDDTRLLQIATDVEKSGSMRKAPPRTPPLDPIKPVTQEPNSNVAPVTDDLKLQITRTYGNDSRIYYDVSVQAPSAITSAIVTINGNPADTVKLDGSTLEAAGSVAVEQLVAQHSQWRVPYGTLVVVIVKGSFGTLGSFDIVGGRWYHSTVQYHTV